MLVLACIRMVPGIRVRHARPSSPLASRGSAPAFHSVGCSFAIRGLVTGARGVRARFLERGKREGGRKSTSSGIQVRFHPLRVTDSSTSLFSFAINRYADPPAQLSAARLWAIMLRNGSELFLAQCLQKKFLDSVVETVQSTRTSPVVRERLTDVVAAAAYATQSTSLHSFRLR